MKNTLKRTIALVVVLTIVVSCTCAFAFSWKQWGKDFGNAVEKAAEDYADQIEVNGECKDGNYDVAGDFLTLTNGFLTNIFTAFSGK